MANTYAYTRMPGHGPFDGPGRPIFRVRVAEAIVAFDSVRGALNLNLNVAGEPEDFDEHYVVDAANSAQHAAARSNFNCAY